MGWSDSIKSNSTQIKCGEIILLDDSKFVFACTLCDEGFHSIMFFRNHLKRIHNKFTKTVPCIPEKDENLLEKPTKQISNEESKDEIDIIDTNINFALNDEEEEVKDEIDDIETNSNFVLNNEEEIDDKDFQDTFIEEIFIEDMFLTQENNISENAEHVQAIQTDSEDDNVKPYLENKTIACKNIQDLLPKGTNEVITRSRKKKQHNKIQDNIKREVILTQPKKKSKQKEHTKCNQSIFKSDKTNTNPTKNNSLTCENVSDQGPITRHQCEECGKCFKKRFHLTDHMYIHSGIHPYKCDACDSSFTHRNSLRTHRFLHTDYRPHRCNQCDKGYVTNSALKVHLRKHTGERPYVCEYCESTFASKPPYHRHMLNHTGIRSHKCTHCEKAFTHKDRLKKHMDCHLNEKKFVCDICSTKFNHKNNLTQHRKLHLDIKEYICKVCNKDFAQFSGLRSHMKYHKNKE